jgi:pimeloyl-ACP methyl ester carboxylesterase
MAAIPQTCFVRSGDVDLAYQVFGTGADMVVIPGLPTHLEVMWELAEFAAFLDRLASFRRVIIFDKRGTGMSDRVPGTPTLEQQVDDVIAVMGAAGSARASVAGWADGAFMAAMFAATYPERVSALVLGGLWLKALAGRPGTLAPDPDVAQMLAERIEPGWRHGVLAEMLAPSYVNDERFRSWWRRWECTRPRRRRRPARSGGRPPSTRRQFCPLSRRPPWSWSEPAPTKIINPGGSPRPRSQAAGMCGYRARTRCRS